MGDPTGFITAHAFAKLLSGSVGLNIEREMGIQEGQMGKQLPDQEEPLSCNGSLQRAAIPNGYLDIKSGVQEKDLAMELLMSETLS